MISTIKVRILRTMRKIPHQQINLTDSRKIIPLLIMRWKILLQTTKKLIAAKEAPGYLESDYDENEIYSVENISLKQT